MKFSISIGAVIEASILSLMLRKTEMHAMVYITNSAINKEGTITQQMLFLRCHTQ